MGLNRLATLTKHLLIFLPFLFPYFSYGQKYSLGLKAGALVSWPSFSDPEVKDTLSRTLRGGYTFGALVAFPMKKDFHFIAEAGYSQKGRRLTFNEGIWVNRTTFRFIDATLLLRKSYTFKLEKNVPSQWFFNIGPDISYWLNGDGEFTAGGKWYPYDIAFGDSLGTIRKLALEDVNRWLFGLTLGVGIKAPLRRNQKISAELRFVSGHTYMSDKHGVDQEHFPVLGYLDTFKTNLKSVALIVNYTLDFDVQQQRKGKSTLDRKMKVKRKR